MFLFCFSHLTNYYISHCTKVSIPCKTGNYLFVFTICLHPLYFQPPLGKVSGREYRGIETSIRDKIIRVRNELWNAQLTTSNK